MSRGLEDFVYRIKSCVLCCCGHLFTFQSFIEVLRLSMFFVLLAKGVEKGLIILLEFLLVELEFWLTIALLVIGWN